MHFFLKKTEDFSDSRDFPLLFRGCKKKEKTQAKAERKPGKMHCFPKSLRGGSRRRRAHAMRTPCFRIAAPYLAGLSFEGIQEEPFGSS